MPPAVRFTRDDVLKAAYELVRREGPASLNARAVAKELGGSTQPIFRLFTGMDELRIAVIQMADETIRDRMTQFAKAEANPYLAICLCYCRFAKDEPQLFKLLFMRDRVTDGSYNTEYAHSWAYDIIANSVKVDRETAIQIYARSFFYAHGLAVCFATQYMPCMSDDRLKAMLRQNLQSAARALNVVLPGE